MIITNTPVTATENLKYLPDEIRPIFVDIETTGLSARTAAIYLIGVSDGITVTQWMAEDLTEECNVIQAFKDYLLSHEDYTLIHFNGQRFDLPFIKKRADKYLITFHFDEMPQIDLFKEIRQYRKILSLNAVNQKAIEGFLGITREDCYDGGRLIRVYMDAAYSDDKSGLDLCLLHNLEDVQGMPGLLSMLAYKQLYDLTAADGELSILKDTATQAGSPHQESCADSEGNPDPEGISRQEATARAYIHFRLTLPLPVAIKKADSTGQIILSASGNEVTLTIPVFQGVLKRFYNDYKNYWYLPDTDECIHKSMASFVDASRRVKCDKGHCYTKANGLFLMQSGAIEPVFSFSTESELNYIALTPAARECTSKHEAAAPLPLFDAIGGLAEAWLSDTLSQFLGAHCKAHST
jgi:hypothetical protein